MADRPYAEAMNDEADGLVEQYWKRAEQIYESVMGEVHLMAELWKGAPVAAALTERLCGQAERLQARGISPTLAIVRVGERSEDLSYERGACKRCEMIGISVKHFILPVNCTQEELLTVIRRINEDGAIHGCLLFRPLPRHLDEAAVCAALSPRQGCGWHHQRFPGQCILR